MRNDGPNIQTQSHKTKEKKKVSSNIRQLLYILSCWGMVLSVSFILYISFSISTFYRFLSCVRSLLTSKLEIASSLLSGTHLVGDFRVNRVEGLVGSATRSTLPGTPRSVQPKNKLITY